MQYYIWTHGCQMNVADSQLLASELEKLGHRAAADGDDADIMIVNTCVVRQSAEDKGLGRLQLLSKIKEAQPHKVIGVMGCMVGVRDPLWMRQRLPYVDIFMPPSDPAPMVNFLSERRDEADVLALEAEARTQRDALQDGELLLPLRERGRLVSAHVPVVYGCSHACTFCIIPFRRGVERSRRVGEILAHVRSLALQGVKEVTLLGQIVDRYGKDIPDGPDLADLLRIVHEAAEEVGIERIRFLTSHPNWMTAKLLRAVAELPRVMPHIEVPIQAGDDDVLARMRRGYTADQYRRLVSKIRNIIPQVAIHTDIIVGFPGETRAQFMETYRLLEELKLDKAHLARYSPRPQTVSQRRMEDDVPDEEKRERLRMLEDLQARVVAEINARRLGEIVEVLVEEEYKGRWRARTPQNKLVFFEAEGDWKGRLAQVEITWTGPWSMQARLPLERAEAVPPLILAG
ncbi:MAG: tRNA (N6-isopentenyl adenosine(37)-C2)-methylthiotransferase MiaB [Chloroflexota bacterium]|nr:tRNA (N6-isopentenyl adenosine(37)-C2)-methylthiotransferase MiaB [Chloroflexota bacterium]MDE2947315.1 tRNA (N6-isopentenyl adenosine(37)-C2)-methylthiotransferase MiaB [Chloroflexota bacterium]